MLNSIFLIECRIFIMGATAPTPSPAPHGWGVGIFFPNSTPSMQGRNTPSVDKGVGVDLHLSTPLPFPSPIDYYRV